jgi:hypothetical protein
VSAVETRELFERARTGSDADQNAFFDRAARKLLPLIRLRMGRTLRSEVESRDSLQAVLLCMLLVTPSGWVYYLPVAAGPIASVAAVGPRSWWWVVGSVALLFPYPLLAMGQPSAWATMTIASSYFWGGAVLLVAVLRTAGWRIHRRGETVDDHRWRR